jgi:hypothetical protein
MGDVFDELCGHGLGTLEDLNDLREMSLNSDIFRVQKLKFILSILFLI